MIPAASVRGAARRLLCRTLGLWPEADTRARSADEITDLAIGRIDRARALGRPYFLFVNYFDAHERALVPAPWAGSFSRKPARETGVLFETLQREMNRTGRVAISARDLDDLVARYDETLAYLDASLGRLVEHAAGSGGDADTLIVVTSDHGEAWGEHDTIGHGSTLHQEQVHVPLVVRSPGQASARVVVEPVGLAAVFGLLTGPGFEMHVRRSRRRRVVSARPGAGEAGRERRTGALCGRSRARPGNRRARRALRSVARPGGETEPCGRPEFGGRRRAAVGAPRRLDRGSSSGRLARDVGEPRGSRAAARARISSVTMRVLGAGELYVSERFGPDIVSRGAILYGCEWDGGVFESGVMWGGIFRAGVVPRRRPLGRVVARRLVRGRLLAQRLRAGRSIPAARDTAGAGRVTMSLTVFAASVRLDLARLWLACMRRALPDPAVRIDISTTTRGDGGLRDDLLPGAEVIGPAAGRRDFQEAYNDALLRVATPFLLLADTDVFWTSTGFPSALEERFLDPAVAAVSLVSRVGDQGHGTFAVAVRTAAYRAALADVPDGFLPRVDGEKEGPPPGRWSGNDTGDLLMRAVVARGGGVDLLRFDAGAGSPGSTR